MLEPWTTPRRSSPACWCARSCPWARQPKEDLERRLVPVSSGKQFGTKLSAQHHRRSDIGPSDGSPTDAWPPDHWSRGQLTHRSWKPTGLFTSRQFTQWLWFHMYKCATRPFTSRQFSSIHMNHRWFYPACLSTQSQFSYRPMNNRRFCPICHFNPKTVVL